MIKTIRKYWKGNEWKFINSFIKLPYFLIHELAHIIFNFVLGNKMRIEECSFYKEVKNGIRYYSLSLDVNSKNNTYSLLGLLAPSIVWLSIVSYSLYDLYYNHSFVSFLIFSY